MGSDLFPLRLAALARCFQARVPIVSEAVDPEARGIFLSLVALGAEESVLEGLDDQRRAMWQDLLSEKGGPRAGILAQWRAEAASTLPQGLDRLHPSWIVAALEGEPVYIIQCVLPNLPECLRAWVLGMPVMGCAGTCASEEIEICPVAIRREIERMAFGWLAPLCACDCGPLAESLRSLAFDELLSEVTRRGARTVGQSLSGSAPALRARAMAAAGDPWAQILGDASSESTSDADRKIAMAHASTRLPDSARTPSERLLHIGLAALKSELAAENPGSVHGVAGRLPVALGRTLVGW